MTNLMLGVVSQVLFRQVDLQVVLSGVAVQIFNGVLIRLAAATGRHPETFPQRLVFSSEIIVDCVG